MGTPLPLPKKEAEPPRQFSAHFYCGQMAGWIKIPLGMEVGLGAGHIVLDGDPALPPSKKGAQRPIFRPVSVVAKQLHFSATAEHLLYHIVAVVVAVAVEVLSV